MATIKSYTDISQSKTLSKILPLESADMHYHYDFDFDELESIPTITEEDDHFVLFPEDVRCWSLAALFGVLPKGNNISTPKHVIELGYCCWNQYDEIYADNPIDACYEMILKLHELKML